MAAFSIAMLGPAAARAACPNEAVRAEQASTSLPGCRAYELVSPPGGTPFVSHPEGSVIAGRAAAGGNGIAWFSYLPLEGSSSGGFYDLSQRGPSGWSTEGVAPTTSTYNAAAFACFPSVFFSDDLSAAVMMDGYESVGSGEHLESGYCGSNSPPLVEDEPVGAQNVFRRDTATGAYQLVNVTPTEVTPSDAAFQGASADFSHIVFEESARLTPEAPSGASLYEWAAGAVHLISVLPNGTPSEGAIPEAIGPAKKLFGMAPYKHTVSADGSRVVFENEGELYLREHAEHQQSPLGTSGECTNPELACTIQLDASQAGGPGGGGVFLAANATDTKIFFTDEAEAKLTADTGEESGQHLYEYDTESGKLTDLTPAGTLGLLGFSGISANGEYLYFTAEAALAGGVSEQPNMYVVHDHTIALVATLASGDVFDWLPAHLTAQVADEGRLLAFNSLQPLKGYDNTDVRSGEPDSEIYLYDAVAGSLRCISCEPSGARPSAPAALPEAEQTGNTAAPKYLQRNLLDDGRVFFETREPLLGVGNGRENVYENAAGSLSLISTGTSEADSHFYDASENGNDVFFITTQHLVRGDTGNGTRLYDARVDGGFAEPATPVSCQGETCRAAGTVVPSFVAPASSQVHGSGNLPPPPAPSHRTLTRKQKLARALRLCRRDRNKHKRAVCIRQAQRRYGTYKAKPAHKAQSQSDRGGQK